MKIYQTIAAIIVWFLLLTCNVWGEVPSGYMDYHDYNETYALLRDLATHPYVELKTIGYGGYWPYAGIPPLTYDIYALRIGPIPADGEPNNQDGGDAIPAILFNGGIHAREWLSTESLLGLARYLAENTENEASMVPDLLRRVAVWIIPMSNPAGRTLDDWHQGDPRFSYTCDDSPPEPNTCGNQQYGWRHNADLRHCIYGVDIARNFSSGWSDAYDDCQPDDPPGSDSNAHWRGFAPFSTTEAAALSEFVQNHLICMAVDIHTTSQKIWNLWGDHDLAGKKMRQRVVEIWNQGLETLGARIYERPAPGPLYVLRYLSWLTIIDDFRDRYTLDNTGAYGGGSGQFTGWLEEEENIQTIAVELPINGSSRYKDYEFQAEPDDGSNSFHPSDATVGNLIDDAFIPMARYLIGQADSPSRATLFVTRRGEQVEVMDGNGSHPIDLGILAAKIGKKASAPGMLETRHAELIGPSEDGWYINLPAYDYLPPGEYKLFYWIMNYSRGARSATLDRPMFREQNNCLVHFTLKSRDRLSNDPWETDYDSTKKFRLKKWEKMDDFFEFTVEPGDHGKEYELTISITPIIDSALPISLTDDFTPNDQKVFRFSTFYEDID